MRELDIPLEQVTPRAEERAVEILLQYADKSFSFFDATSFAVMERLGVRQAFTFDRHFEQLDSTFFLPEASLVRATAPGMHLTPHWAPPAQGKDSG